MTRLTEFLLYRILRPLIRRWRESRYRYTRLVEVRIYKKHLLHNFDVFRKAYPSLGIAPVLKSNAYGHGLVETARTFDTRPIPFLVVDGYFEALILRNERVRAPVMIVGYTATENIINNKLRRIAFTILDLPQLLEVSDRLTSPQRFHLKIDTGMHRQGIMLSEVELARQAFAKNNNLILEGICSHLADADGSDPSFTLRQINKWKTLVASWKADFPGIRYFHLAATEGSRYADLIQGNVMRIGLGLYGIPSRATRDLHLKPALEIVTRIGALKKLGKGDMVGYNATFQAQQDMHLAVIPTGYNSCVDRRLSNKGCFKIKNTLCPIAGNVSMNITTVDVTAVDNVQIGDEVIIISKEKGDLNTVEQIAGLCNTIPYLILVNISPGLHRTVVDG